MSLYPWQHSYWHKLHSYRLQQRVPQALLISGKKGMGKQHLAEQFAVSLLCGKPQPDGLACGLCHSCLLFKAKTHPDYILLQPEESGKIIPINAIRKLTHDLCLKPQFENYRVVLINPGEALNINAANAFLKYLEEPTERTVILLLSENLGRLPATIRSRCQKLIVSEPSKELTYEWLKEQGISEKAEVLVSLAQGAPLLALQYAQDNYLILRDECFKAWLSVAGQQTHPVVIAEKWHKLPESALLFWLSSWIIDLIKCSYQKPAIKLYNPDLQSELQTLAVNMKLTELYKLYDLLLVSKERVTTTINKQLIFEEILIRWALLNRSK